MLFKFWHHESKTTLNLINSTSPLQGFKQDILRRRWPLSLECQRLSSADCNIQREWKSHKKGTEMGILWPHPLSCSQFVGPWAWIYQTKSLFFFCSLGGEHNNKLFFFLFSLFHNNIDNVMTVVVMTKFTSNSPVTYLYSPIAFIANMLGD